MSKARAVTLSRYRPPKVSKIDEAAMAMAEVHLAKASALMVGASKILSDFVNGSSWGTSTSITVAVELLHQAKDEHDSGSSIARKAKRES